MVGFERLYEVLHSQSGLMKQCCRLGVFLVASSCVFSVSVQAKVALLLSFLKSQSRTLS